MEKTRNLLMYLIAAAIAFWLVLNWEQVSADELETTWRVGDILPYHAGCFSERAAMDVLAAAAKDWDTWVASIKEKEAKGACFFIVDRNGEPQMMLIELKEWIFGPVTLDMGGGIIVTVSLWRGVDIENDEVWLTLEDDAGWNEKASRI